MYSAGSTTATRFPLTTICVFGNAFVFSLPTETSVEPSVAGCTTRACSIPGNLTSPTKVAVPATMGGIVRIGIDWPTTWYSLIGLVGGLPLTVRPKRPCRLPVTGIVRLSCWPATSCP